MEHEVSFTHKTFYLHILIIRFLIRIEQSNNLITFSESVTFDVKILIQDNAIPS